MVYKDETIGHRKKTDVPLSNTDTFKSNIQIKHEWI